MEMSGKLEILQKALEEIARFDPIEEYDFEDGCGEALAFVQCQKIAKKALDKVQGVDELTRRFVLDALRAVGDCDPPESAIEYCGKACDPPAGYHYHVVWDAYEKWHYTHTQEE